MKMFQHMAVAAGLAVMMPVAAMAQDGGQGAGPDIGSQLLAELTGQLDLPASQGLRSDSRRTYGQTGPRGGDKDAPALAGAQDGPGPMAERPQTPPQRPQTEPVQQVNQTLPPPPPPAPSQVEVVMDDKTGADTGIEPVGAKPRTVSAGYYGY